MKSRANRILIICIATAVVLLIAELMIDYRMGDGDGKITQYNLHGIILSIQFLLLLTASIIFIRQSVTWFFSRGKGMINRLGKVMLLLMYVTALFLLIELLSRIIAPSEGSFDRIYPVENARHPFPYVMFKGKGLSLTGYGDEVYNKQGYRGKYPSVPKPEEEFRIVVMGGSAVWEGDTTLTDFLQAGLRNNRLPHAAVYNFGVVGANASMHWITLVNEVISLQPDLVVFYDGANDIIHPLHYDPRPGYPFNFLLYENNPFLMKSFPAFVLLAYKSNLFRLMARKYLAEKIAGQSSLRKQAGYLSPEWRNEIAEVYLNTKRKAVPLCSLQNIKCITFLQPTVYSKKQLSANENQFAAARTEERQQVEIVSALISTLAQKDSLLSGKFFDLSNVFDSVAETIYRDNVHISNEGRKVVSKKMAEVIISELQLQAD